jgi:hypothetical protein
VVSASATRVTRPDYGAWMAPVGSGHGLDARAGIMLQ